jgi:putative FmdB family regulatory protein
MPIYGYICKSCEHTLDALQKISDDPLVFCPDCGEPQLKRQLSAPRFRLKGKGWYETDFKTKNQRNLHGDKEPATKDDKSAGKKSDSKASADKPKTTSAAGD